jgi:hypothetical protein
VEVVTAGAHRRSFESIAVSRAHFARVGETRFFSHRKSVKFCTDKNDGTGAIALDTGKAVTTYAFFHIEAKIREMPSHKRSRLKLLSA